MPLIFIFGILRWFQDIIHAYVGLTEALLLPYFVWANSEGSGETVRMRKLDSAFAGRLCDKYHISWAGSNFKFFSKHYFKVAYLHSYFSEF